MEQSGRKLSPSSAFPRSNAQSSSRSRSPRRQETADSEKAGRVWARQPDEDAWAPCILTLDGGGIRGYSSLLILKELMHQICIWENKLEDEERSMERPHDDARTTDRSNDTQQATAGAGDSRSLPRERSPLSRQLDDNVEDIESQFVVSSGVCQPEHDNPTDNHMQSEPSTIHATNKRVILEDELLPCHYFDFMYGTSTGGLIATILGRLRMTVADGLELYRKVGDDLFGKRRSYLPLMTKYHHQPLERAVRDIVASRCHEHPNCDGNDMHPWDSDHMEEVLEQPVPFDVDRPRVCQSCCLTATHDKNISEAYLLRSYPHHYSEKSPNWVTRYNEGADRLPIWVCTRATTAAPFYFKMMKAEVGGQEMAFKDGGIRENNPSAAAMSEFHALYDGKVVYPALLLSIGTGRPDQSKDGFSGALSGPLDRLPFVTKFLEKRAIIRNLLIKYTEGEKLHHQMREHAQGEHHWYKRLNVSDGLQNMPLDDWRKGDWHDHPNMPGGATLTRMEDVTTEYLKREFDPNIDSYAPPSIMLRQTAEKLVRQRRARQRNGGLRWKAFIGRHLHQPQKLANGGTG